jgi:hypothetical protein
MKQGESRVEFTRPLGWPLDTPGHHPTPRGIHEKLIGAAPAYLPNSGRLTQLDIPTRVIWSRTRKCTFVALCRSLVCIPARRSNRLYPDIQTCLRGGVGYIHLHLAYGVYSHLPVFSRPKNPSKNARHLSLTSTFLIVGSCLPRSPS